MIISKVDRKIKQTYYIQDISYNNKNNKKHNNTDDFDDQREFQILYKNHKQNKNIRGIMNRFKIWQ